MSVSGTAAAASRLRLRLRTNKIADEAAFRNGRAVLQCVPGTKQTNQTMHRVVKVPTATPNRATWTATRQDACVHAPRPNKTTNMTFLRSIVLLFSSTCDDMANPHAMAMLPGTPLTLFTDCRTLAVLHRAC